MVARTQKYSDDETPKWSYWKEFKKVTLEEAVLLSLGVNPDLIPYQLEALQSFYDTEIAERTEIAYSWANDASWASWPIETMPSIYMVDLVKFIKWCHEDRQWKRLPTEFLEMDEAKNSTKEVDGSAEKPKNRRLENNDLRLIGALRKMLQTNDIYPTNSQLIDDLSEIYKGKEPFKKTTLEIRFAEAKRILESD